MKVFILGALFSLNLFAQDFVVRIPDDLALAPQYGLEEFSRMLQVSPADLESYKCDGVSEHDMFRPSPTENLALDSLRVLGNEGETEPVVYRKGSYYRLNGKSLYSTTNPMLLRTLEDLRKIEKVKEGARMLRLLERSNHAVTIRQGLNNFEPTLPGGQAYYGVKMASAISIIAGKHFVQGKIPFSGIGSGGFVFWNPNIKNNLPPHVILAHELFHALDSVRGLFDQRSIDGATYEKTTVGEFRASYLENLVRKAAGVKLRKYYGEIHEGPGLLDEQGKPRPFPNPCL